MEYKPQIDLFRHTKRKSKDNDQLLLEQIKKQLAEKRRKRRS